VQQILQSPPVIQAALNLQRSRAQVRTIRNERGYQLRRPYSSQMRSPQLHSNDRDTACRSGKCTARTNFITRPRFRHFRVEASSASPIFSAVNSIEDPLSVTVFPLPSEIEAEIRARLRRLRGCGPLSTNAGAAPIPVQKSGHTPSPPTEPAPAASAESSNIRANRRPLSTRIYALAIDAPTKCSDERDAESARAS
jgi:hypothetical protein